MRTHLVFAALLAVILAACGGSDTADTAGIGSDETPLTTVAESDAAPKPDDQPAADLPGGIVLTIGDETWEFEGASCAFINAKPGDPESEWNVSFIKEGLQVYANDDSYGPRLSIADIAHGTSPNLSWVAEGDAVSFTIDGDEIIAKAIFTDEVGGAGPTEGTLTATCAIWAQG